MSYNKTNWQTGDIVTADKLNNIETGVEQNNVFYIHVPVSVDLVMNGGDAQVTVDINKQDIIDAYHNGKTLAVKLVFSGEQINGGGVSILPATMIMEVGTQLMLMFGNVFWSGNNDVKHTCVITGTGCSINLADSPTVIAVVSNRTNSININA